MAGVFPGAPDLDVLEQHRRRTRRGHRGPAERWDPALYYDAATAHGRTTPSKWGGFLPAIPFDPLAYGIPPRVARARSSRSSCSPRGRAAGAGRRRLGDAAVRPRADLGGVRRRGRHRPVPRLRLPGLAPDATSASAGRARRELPRLTEDSFPGVLANVIAGRIANRLDLGGVNYTVDAACASSLAALDVACKELTRRHQRPGARAAAPTCTTASTTTCCSPASTRCRPPAGAAPSTPRRRHRARRGRRVRGAQAPRRRRARRRPDLRGHQGRRRLSDGRSPRAHRAPPGGPARAPSSAPTPSAGVSPAAGRAGRGARHRHRGRRPHRAGHAHRGLQPRPAPRRAAARSAR